MLKATTTWIAASCLMALLPQSRAQSTWNACGAAATQPSATEEARSSRHYILEFPAYPDAAKRAELVNRGIAVLDYIPPSGLLVAMGARTDICGTNASSARPLRIDEKLSPELPTRVVGYLVILHADVDVRSTKALISSIGFEHLRNGHLLPGHLLLTGNRDRLSSLAGLDEVAYIMPASPDLIAGNRVLACAGPIAEAGPIREYASMRWLTSLAVASAFRYSLGFQPDNPAGDIRHLLEAELAFREWQKYSDTSLLSPGRERDLDLDLGHSGVDDTYTLAVHRAGHALGLPHSSRPGDIMYPYFASGALTDHDIAALRSVVSGGAKGHALQFSQSAARTQVSAKKHSTTPDLTVSITHAGSFAQGQSGATYTITARNSGNGPTNGTVTVSAWLPSGLSATAMTGDKWNCVQPAGPCSRTDVLSGGSSYPPIKLAVNVAVDAPPSLSTSVQVSGGGQSNLSNDTATDKATVLQTIAPVSQPLLLSLLPSLWDMTGGYYSLSPHPEAGANGTWMFSFPQRSTNQFIGYITQNLPKGTSIAGKKTLQMTFSVTTTGSPVFRWDSGSTNTCYQTPATTRAIIWGATNPNANESRWFPHYISYTLAPGTVTITVPLTPDQWSDVNGSMGDANATTLAGFAASLSNVGSIGLVFGGGCYYGHGVDIDGGSATFQLLDFRVN